MRMSSEEYFRSAEGEGDEGTEGVALEPEMLGRPADAEHQERRYQKTRWEKCMFLEHLSRMKCSRRSDWSKKAPYRRNVMSWGTAGGGGEGGGDGDGDGGGRVGVSYQNTIE